MFNNGPCHLDITHDAQCLVRGRLGTIVCGVSMKFLNPDPRRGRRSISRPTVDVYGFLFGCLYLNDSISHPYTDFGVCVTRNPMDRLMN